MVIKQRLSGYVKSDKTKNILIYLYSSKFRQMEFISTNFYVLPEEWRGEVLSRRPNAGYINSTIRITISDIEAHWLQNQHLSPKEIKRWYADQKKEIASEEIKHTPLSYFDYFITACESGSILHKKTKQRLSQSYINAFTSCKLIIKEYSPNIAFNSVNESYYNGLVMHMREKKNYKSNYIAKTIKNFKHLLNHAKKNKLHDNEDFKDYIVSWEKSFKLKLTEYEVERMSTVDLSGSPELIPEQERFQVAYNFLLRFNDSISISEKNVIFRDKKPFLSLMTGKTKEEVLIPIKAKVYQILKNNGFKIKASNYKSNIRLKKIAAIAKINDKVVLTEYRKGKKVEVVKFKWQMVETHTTRRSAARHLFDSKMRTHIIMALGGWTSEEQLLEYIDIDKEYAAKEAVLHPFFK